MAFCRFSSLVFVWLMAAGSLQAQLLPPGQAPLPATSREWTSADYEIVAAALADGRLALPRFNSRESSELLRRLVSIENLRFLENKAIPIQARMPEFIRLQASLGAILKLYGAADFGGADVHSELAAVFSFLVRASASGGGVLAEWIPVMPRDATYEIRMKGVEQVKSGVANILLGAEASLGEAIYSESDKSMILDAMADSIESLKEFLARDVQAELRQKLQNRRSIGTHADILNYERLIRALGP